MSFKLIYIAGPYRADNWRGDVDSARPHGAEVVERGHYPVIPHANTSHYDGLSSDQFWLDTTLELMRRCDAVLMVQGWKSSHRATLEHAAAVANNMLVYYSPEDVPDVYEESVINRPSDPGSALARKELR